MLIGKGEKLVMIGDSVTDCGRAQPVAEGLFDPLGRGYVTFVDPLLAHVHSAALSWDRVHPNQTGHMVIARAFLDAIGFSWTGAPA